MDQENTQTVLIDKISSEEDAEQLKSSLKPIDLTKTLTIPKIEQQQPSSSHNERTRHYLQVKDQSSKLNENDIDITSHVITTREQRVQRVRARVSKKVQGCTIKDIDANYKVVLIGDAGVGKTSLLLRFADNIFNSNPLSTIGVDFKIKTLKVDEKIIKMQIWDTAGQERFKSISQAYFRNANGCLAVFDITNRESFESLKTQVKSYISYKYGNQTTQVRISQAHNRNSQQQDEQDGHGVGAQYLNTEGIPDLNGLKVNGGNPTNGDTNKPSLGIKSQKVATNAWDLPMLKNIIVVGTKQDLCAVNGGRKTNGNKREVDFQEVIDFCREYELSGCLEVSSRTDLEHAQQYQFKGKKSQGKAPFADLNDAFFMVACNCVDYTTRQIMAEMADSMPNLPPNHPLDRSKLDLSRSQIANNETVIINGQLDPNGLNTTLRQNQSKHMVNKTFNYGFKNTQCWQVQSEQGLVQKGRMANDSSFYSFKLHPGKVNGVEQRAPQQEKQESEYRYVIHRRYDIETNSDSSFNRNSCC